LPHKPRRAIAAFICPAKIDNVRLGSKKSGHVSVAAFGVSFETALIL
jgi:hypothetical protein